MICPECHNFIEKLDLVEKRTSHAEVSYRECRVYTDDPESDYYHTELSCPECDKVFIASDGISDREIEKFMEDKCYALEADTDTGVLFDVEDLDFQDPCPACVEHGGCNGCRNFSLFTARVDNEGSLLIHDNYMRKTTNGE